MSGSFLPSWHSQHHCHLHTCCTSPSRSLVILEKSHFQHRCTQLPTKQFIHPPFKLHTIFLRSCICLVNLQAHAPVRAAQLTGYAQGQAILRSPPFTHESSASSRLPWSMSPVRRVPAASHQPSRCGTSAAQAGLRAKPFCKCEAA